MSDLGAFEPLYAETHFWLMTDSLLLLESLTTNGNALSQLIRMAMIGLFLPSFWCKKETETAL